MNVSFKSAQATQTNSIAPNQNHNNYTTNVASTLNHSKASDVLLDKNYGVLQTKKMNVSFKGMVPIPPPSSLPSLGEKINGLLDIAKPNDVILVSNGLKNGMKQLEKHIDAFTSVIKRVLYVEDKEISHPVAFNRTQDARMFTNIGETTDFIKDGSKKDAKFFAKPGESLYLTPNDTVKVGEKNIPLDTDTSSVPIQIKSKYATVLDFTPDVEEPIQKINKNTIHKLTFDPSESPEKKITFSDVGGQDDAIKALKKNILFPIKYPSIKQGHNMNKSALLYGPPGTGKSLLAEALANESKANFVKINASELESKWVGESEENWRTLFDTARENQPTIIFIDEFDAVAKKRGGQDTYGDKTLNTILGLMSDSEKRGDDIYMIAATNNKDALDKAATRAGRFGLPIEVGAPDLKGTKQILGIYTKKEPMAKDFKADEFAEKLHKEKATGAEIASITEQARNNAFERENLYEKMDKGTFEDKDMENLKIKNEDYDKAIDDFKKTRESDNPKAQVKPRNQIGYTSEQYKARDKKTDKSEKE